MNMFMFNKYLPLLLPLKCRKKSFRQYEFTFRISRRGPAQLNGINVPAQENAASKTEMTTGLGRARERDTRERERRREVRERSCKNCLFAYRMLPATNCAHLVIRTTIACAQAARQ